MRLAEDNETDDQLEDPDMTKLEEGHDQFGEGL